MFPKLNNYIYIYRCSGYHIHIHGMCCEDKPTDQFFDVVTLWQQAVCSIMADVPRIRIGNPNLLNFGSVIEQTL